MKKNLRKHSKNLEKREPRPRPGSFQISLFVFTVSCSKGTYIRVLGKEIAEKLGTVGYLNSLIRTRVGEYFIDDSVSLDQFKLSWKSYAH